MFVFNSIVWYLKIGIYQVSTYAVAVWYHGMVPYVMMMVLLCAVFGCRVLSIQSQSKDADVQKRVLQTMVMVVTWKSCDMTEDTVAQVYLKYY